jgi:hypothetical protein
MADRPAHILEIPESLGRDVDRYREGKGAAPPVEAFMSDAALEQGDRQTAAAAEPVHAEDLVPITKAEAAARTTFDGEHLPRVPATRRVIPAPFRRPRFDLDRHGRAWATCRADDVAPGDMVAVGGAAFRVASAERVIRYETVAGVPDVAIGMKVIITGIAGNQVVFEPGSNVRAFRQAELCAVVAGGARESWTSAAGPESAPTVTRATSTSRGWTSSPG